MSNMLFDFVSRELIAEKKARKLLAPFKQDLLCVWERSMKSWMNIPETERGRLGETSFLPSVNLYGFAQSYAKETFVDREDEGIEICEEIPNVIAMYIKRREYWSALTLCDGMWFACEGQHRSNATTSIRLPFVDCTIRLRGSRLAASLIRHIQRWLGPRSPCKSATIAFTTFHLMVIRICWQCRRLRMLRNRFRLARNFGSRALDSESNQS